MKKATVIRVDDIRQTLGVMNVDNGGFVSKSLELPWKNNDNNISCIPIGKYTCKYTRSPRMSVEHLTRWLKKNVGKTEADCPESEKNVYTYEIMNVPKRGGVRIHSANYFHQLRGCIALGNAAKDMDMDGCDDISHSGQTIKAFEKYMNYEDFELEIKYINGK